MDKSAIPLEVLKDRNEDDVDNPVDNSTEPQKGRRGKGKPSGKPLYVQSPFFVALKALNRDEIVFVKDLLRGTPIEDAARHAFKHKGHRGKNPGYQDFDVAGTHLSKPAVLTAIKAGISRCSDIRTAYQLLSYVALPVALDIIENGSNQERITLIRDIWDRSGYVAIHKSESKRLDVKGILSDIQARRKLQAP